LFLPVASNLFVIIFILTSKGSLEVACCILGMDCENPQRTPVNLASVQAGVQILHLLWSNINYYIYNNLFDRTMQENKYYTYVVVSLIVAVS
jgi:hypothetical protein